MENIDRKGKKWTEEEEIQLLKEVRKKKTIEEMSQLHSRTIGGIKSRLREFAYRYFCDERPIDEICILTGLEKEDVLETITRREAAEEYKKEKKEQTKPTIVKDVKEVEQPPLLQILELVKEIRDLLKHVVNNHSQNVNSPVTPVANDLR